MGVFNRGAGLVFHDLLVRIFSKPGQTGFFGRSSDQAKAHARKFCEQSPKIGICCMQRALRATLTEGDSCQEQMSIVDDSPTLAG